MDVSLSGANVVSSYILVEFRKNFEVFFLLSFKKISIVFLDLYWFRFVVPADFY